MKSNIYLKKTNNNKIKAYQVEQISNRYRSIHWYYPDGKVTTNEWQVATTKNEGKSNEVASEAQATLEVSRLLEEKKHEGYVIIEDFKDERNTKFFEPMLAHSIKNILEFVNKNINLQIATQPKFDGVRLLLSTQFGALSRNGKPFQSIPHIANIDLPAGVVLDGELYCETESFNKIISLVRKQKPTSADIEECKKHIKYRVYDAFFNDSPKLSFIKRQERLKHVLDTINSPYIQIVETTYHTITKDSADFLKQQYSSYMSGGYEGMMVRLANSPYENKRSKNLLKYKQFFDEEYRIVAVIEGKGNRAGMAGSVMVETLDHKYQFNASIAGGVEYYKELWQMRDEIVGKLATVVYQEKSEYNIPRFPVLKGVRDYE